MRFRRFVRKRSRDFCQTIINFQDREVYLVFHFFFRRWRARRFGRNWQLSAPRLTSDILRPESYYPGTFDLVLSDGTNRHLRHMQYPCIRARVTGPTPGIRLGRAPNTG